jgi:hypothetical protein
MVDEALVGWEPNNAEERQGMKSFETYASRPSLGRID